MALTDLRPPLIWFKRNLLGRESALDDLAFCTARGLRNGFYDNLLIVDSSGMGYTVRGARKLHSVGRFWGYSLFWGRRIKVELLSGRGPFPVPLGEVKDRVERCLKSWHGWSGRGDFRHLQEAVANAQTFEELINLLADPDPTAPPTVRGDDEEEEEESADDE